MGNRRTQHASLSDASTRRSTHPTCWQTCTSVYLVSYEEFKPEQFFSKSPSFCLHFYLLLVYKDLNYVKIIFTNTCIVAFFVVVVRLFIFVGVGLFGGFFLCV